MLATTRPLPVRDFKGKDDPNESFQVNRLGCLSVPLHEQQASPRRPASLVKTAHRREPGLTAQESASSVGPSSSFTILAIYGILRHNGCLTCPPGQHEFVLQWNMAGLIPVYVCNKCGYIAQAKDIVCTASGDPSLSRHHYTPCNATLRVWQCACGRQAPSKSSHHHHRVHH